MELDNSSLLQKVTQEYKKREKALNGLSGTRFHEVRRKAMESFNKTGFPTIRYEEWKYTNVFPVLNNSLQLNMKSSIKKEDVVAFKIPNVDCYLLVFVNGVYSQELSNALPDEVTYDSVRESFYGKKNSIEEKYGVIADSQKNPFVALNTALSEDGFVVLVPKNFTLDKPVHILTITDATDNDVMTVPRIFIELAENARASVIYTTHTIGSHNSFKNSVIEVIVNQSASLSIISCQNDTGNASLIETIQARIDENAHYSLITLSLGCGFIRNDSNVVLNGKNSEAHLYGLILGDGKRLIDNHTIVDHAQPHCESSELYKYILDDKSTGVFNGKVFVRQDAQKTNAYQSNKTILLSDAATINTKPQLEIFADDVKCSHGATSGQLDEEQLFYLKARGINKEKAQALLLHAFAGDILKKIHIEPIVEWLDKDIAARLHDQS